MGVSCNLTTTEKSYSVANNTSELYVKLTATTTGESHNNYSPSGSITINGTKYTFSKNIPKSSTTTLFEKTVTIAHNADGKKTVAVSYSFATGISAGTLTGSRNVTLTTIPRESTVTCADGNIGSATTININRANSSFTHTITYSFLGVTGTIATKTSSTSIGWTIPTSFYAKIPNAKSGQGTITCQTYSGSTLIGTKTCTFNAFVINSEPTLSATVVDSNSTTVALTGSSSKLIKYFSSAKVDITATAKNSATISSRKVICGNKSGTSTSNTLNNIESGTFKISCSDSRGFYNNITVTKTMVEYIKLVFTELRLTRPSTTSNTVNLSLNGKYFNGSFGSVTNTLSLKMRYRLKGGTWGSYTTLNPTKSNNDFTYSSTLGSTFNYKNDYEFEIVVTDKLMTETKTVIVPAGEPIVDIGKKDVKVNGQIYMGENKVLSFVVTDENNGHFEDAEGNKYYPETDDTGWKTADLQNCTANSNGLGGYPGIVYRKVGNRVTVEGSITVTFSGPTIYLTTLPTGYRPKYTKYNIVSVSGTKIARIGINTSGNIFLDWIINVSDASYFKSETWLAVDLDYFID